MATVDQVKNKVQRILTDKFGSIRVDRDGDYVIKNESAVVFVSVSKWGKDQTVVDIKCPLITNVVIKPELTKWVAIDGQRFIFGSCYLNPNDDGKTGWVWFKTALLGDDLDEAELFESVVAVAITSNELDNDLKKKFGGELFGSES